MAAEDIPELVKHVTLSIFLDRTLPGSGTEKFMRALRIARAVLFEQGYLTRDSVKGPTDKIKLTPKGVARNGKHKRCPKRKNEIFDRLFSKIELAEEEGKLQEDRPTDREQRKTFQDAKNLGRVKATKGTKKYVT